METLSAVQSFNVVVNYSQARTESCLQVVQLEYEETEYLGSTLGLNTLIISSNIVVLSFFSEQEALRMTLEPYYICFLVLLWYFKVLWCHLAIDHLFQSVALSGGLFLRFQSETSNVVILLVIFGLDKLKNPD